ncbi:MAG: DUF3576 domain-containing protein [Alphaproteobacteria bacterium]|nr:DUF3576 domain-containing protein [Alphaproteobacteria bacterium]
MFTKSRQLIGLCSALLLVSACSGGVDDYLVENPERDGEYIYESELKGKEATVFGDGGLDLFNLGKSKNKGGGGSGIAVNSFLWRASLDTVSFMPLSSADPFGGVIITDWYSPPESPTERYKMSVYILGRQLRADGIRVSVFRQQSATGNSWRSGAVSKDTAVNLENQILTRARQLRLVASKAN